MLLEEAVAALADSPARLEYARVLLDYGAALRRAGQRRRATETLRDALDLAHRFGARRLERRAREELTAAGARPRRAAIRGVDALTPSERRVVEMAAAGHSNREIAQLLFVTLRTVEAHLTAAYDKLEIAGRRGLQAALR